MSVGGLAFDKILVMEEIHVFAAVQTFFIFMWKLYQMGSTNFKKLKKDLEVEQFRHKFGSRFISITLVESKFTLICMYYAS